MNIFQLKKKTRRASNLIRRSSQALLKVRASDEPNTNKEVNLEVKISRAQTFLDKVEEWQKNRLAQPARRSSLPKKKQRELGLFPSVELCNEWRANKIRYVVRLTNETETRYVTCKNIGVLKQEVAILVEQKVPQSSVSIFKV